MSGVIFLFVALLSVGYVKSENQPVVSTPLGDVTGYFMKTRGGKQLAAFTALPYAVPPLGDLRFKAPVPISPWEGNYDATKRSPSCVQTDPFTRQVEVIGQEDCLYLNIYIPAENNTLRTSELLPVMAFVHGGGWMAGQATTYGPEFILDRDVILVTFNYRLGPLGFLSTQDKHCPGNNGLKDQQEALRFTQKVITSFGGDKNSVTLFGESAGGASVHYHMKSETSAGLFHRSISESGSAMAPWAEAPPGEPLRNAFRLAKLLDCPQAPSEAMIACLRTKDSYDIVNSQYQLYAWDYDPITPFKAVVEPDLPGAFLTRSPRLIPNVPAVPFITGLNANEGCLKSVWITANASRFEEFLSGFQTIAPMTYYYENSAYVDYITKKLKEHYFKDSSEESIKAKILEIYSDTFFNYPAVEAVEQIFNYTKQPVYLYELTYRATNSFSQVFGDPDGDYGVCHGDDLTHLFPILDLTKPISETDTAISETFLTLWTNFATSGDPNKPNKLPVTWQPATSGHKMEYLKIDVELKMKTNLAASSRFWDSVPTWYNINKFICIDENYEK